jgi:hypothetical protein
MKLLKDKHELAMAINFGKYPVLKIDLADSDDYGLKGCKIRIDAGTFKDGMPFFIHATIRAYRDECKLTTSQGATCLSNSFTYSDYTDMVEFAQAPLIKADQDVVVAVYDSSKRMPHAAFIVHTGKTVSKFCSTPLTFEDADMTPYLLAAGIAPRKRTED